MANCVEMAETKDAHVVEIPINNNQEHQLIISAIQNHPLMEISQSPGHLLLLKLWQREEDHFSHRISRKETRIDVIKSEIFMLCCFFCIFNALFLTILFTSSYSTDDHDHQVCRKWWIPSFLCLFTCIVMIVLVQMKLFRYFKVRDELQRERNDNRSLTRCIQEMRMKGSSFDLCKEPVMKNGKRMKSSSVEIKWKPITWISQFLITIFLVAFTGIVFLASRLMLCA